jgi:hypothetical protein
MTPERSKKKNAAMAQLLKASFQDKRRSPWRLVYIAVGLMVVLGFLLWWFGPEPVPAQLLMAAYDAVVLPDGAVELCAALAPLPPDETKHDLSGCELFFQASTNTRLLGKVTTGPDSVARLSARFDAQPRPIIVTVRYPGIKDRQRGAQAESKVFVWPRESQCLFVDVDHTLAAGDEDSLWRLNNFDLHPRAGAAAALNSLAATNRVVYLSTSANSVRRYGKLRAWLSQARSAGEQRFPEGPLLAPIGTEEPDRFLVNRTNDLVGKFKGGHIAVVGQAGDAEALMALGVKTYLIDDWGKIP